MRAGARLLLGRRDFASFLTRPSSRVGTERTVFAADWLEVSASLLIFEICADAYLKQMVRTIVGSLLWTGTSRWTPERFAIAVDHADRRAAGPTAPAPGLTLHRIDY
jgi:tRNA pseudouridine38-40 synthase